jgi:hypothetical protein
MTMQDNVKFNKKIGESGYQKYDNYDAIEVPFSNAIPSDYKGLMGVPITFLSKHNPDQFEIVGITKTWDDKSGLKTKIYPQQKQILGKTELFPVTKLNDGAALPVVTAPISTHYEVEGNLFVQVYARILIRHRRVPKEEVTNG